MFQYFCDFIPLLIRTERLIIANILAIIFTVFQTMADAKHANSVQQNHSGSEMSSSSTNGDKVTPSDTNANHESNDKFIFSSTSMEFAVSRKVGKYRQKNSSDDINGQKQNVDVRKKKNTYRVIALGGHKITGLDEYLVLFSSHTLVFDYNYLIA